MRSREPIKRPSNVRNQHAAPEPFSVTRLIGAGREGVVLDCVTQSRSGTRVEAPQRWITQTSQIRKKSGQRITNFLRLLNPVARLIGCMLPPPQAGCSLGDPVLIYLALQPRLACRFLFCRYIFSFFNPVVETFRLAQHDGCLNSVPISFHCNRYPIALLITSQRH